MHETAIESSIIADFPTSLFAIIVYDDLRFCFEPGIHSKRLKYLLCILIRSNFQISFRFDSRLKYVRLPSGTLTHTKQTQISLGIAFLVSSIERVMQSSVFGCGNAFQSRVCTQDLVYTFVILILCNVNACGGKRRTCCHRKYLFCSNTPFSSYSSLLFRISLLPILLLKVKTMIGFSVCLTDSIMFLSESCKGSVFVLITTYAPLHSLNTMVFQIWNCFSLHFRSLQHSSFAALIARSTGKRRGPKRGRGTTRWWGTHCSSQR